VVFPRLQWFLPSLESSFIRTEVISVRESAQIGILIASSLSVEKNIKKINRLLDQLVCEDLMFQNRENTRSSSSSKGEGRNFRRKPVEAGLFFSDLKPFTKEKKLRADLIDIGFGGARISTPTPLKKGDWIHPLTYDDSAKEDGSGSLLKSAWNDKAQVVWEKVEPPDSNQESIKANYIYGLEFANNKKANFSYWFFKLLFGISPF